MKKQVRLTEFLQDVAQGVYGESVLTYGDVSKFEEKANGFDKEIVAEFYWDWNSQLTDPEDIDVDELEQIIFNVINQ